MELIVIVVIILSIFALFVVVHSIGKIVQCLESTNEGKYGKLD